jgi:hypothetical protein
MLLLADKNQQDNLIGVVIDTANLIPIFAEEL